MIARRLAAPLGTAATLVGIGLGLAALVAVEGGARPAFAELDKKQYTDVLRKLEDGLKTNADTTVAAALRELARDDSKRAVEVFTKVLRKMWESDEVYRAGRDFVDALTDEKALRELRRDTLKDKDWQVRMFLVDALGEARGQLEVETLGEAAVDKNPRVAVAAVRQLAMVKTLAATDAIIAAMEKLDADGRQDVVWQDCRNALTRLLGTKLDAGMDYRNFLSTRREQFVEGDGMPRGDDPYADGGGSESGTVTIFGEPVLCKKVVIILDCSGSMVLADPYPPGYKRQKPAGTTSREEADKEPDYGNGILDPERRRMFRAKQELLRVVEELAKAGALVNVVAYSTDVTTWRDQGVHQLSADAVRDVKEWIGNLKADGVTATDMALATAFDKAPEADCFYLISDGFATRDGETKIPTADILGMVRERNRLQKAQINTMGFEARSGNEKDGADRVLMEGIAHLTGGTYTQIQ